MNYDNIRTGRTLEVKAKRYAEQQVKNIDNPDEAIAQYEQFYNERYDLLVKEHNKNAIRGLPATAVMVTEETKNNPCIRYSIKPNITWEQANGVMKNREKLICSPDFESKDEALADVLRDAFFIHNITLIEASEQPHLKANPYDCINELKNVPAPLPEVTAKVMPATLGGLGDFSTQEPAPTVIHPDVKKAFEIRAEDLTLEEIDPSLVQMIDEVVDAPADEAIPLIVPNSITGEELQSAMHRMGMSNNDMGKRVDIHHMTVEKWTRVGVADDYIEKVFAIIR